MPSALNVKAPDDGRLSSAKVVGAASSTSVPDTAVPVTAPPSSVMPVNRKLEATGASLVPSTVTVSTPVSPRLPSVTVKLKRSVSVWPCCRAWTAACVSSTA